MMQAPDLLAKILFIQNSIDNKFRLILNPEWKSSEPDFRLRIRQFLAEQFSTHFSRSQLALLNDLNWLPQASDGSVSISHCRTLGGFIYSQHDCGFDVEELKRISLPILQRTCRPDELSECPRTEFLWVAKEAGFKTLSPSYDGDLVLSDLTCTEWQSHFENQVFSFRLKSEKTLDFSLNKGLIFSDQDWLFGFFFR